MDEVLAYATSKANYHTDKIRQLQQGQPIAPLTLQVDPEAFCNDNCRFCAYREEQGYNTEMLKLIGAESVNDRNTFKPLGMMKESSGWDISMAERLPAQMVEAGIPAIEITGGGEPTLWKGFDRLLNNLIKCEREIGLVTNGSTLNDSRIKLISTYEKFMWVRFSFDSANAETHQKVHRTPKKDFERRIENLKRLVNQKTNNVEIGISFVIVPENVDELEDAARLFSKIGVNHLRYSWMYDKTHSAGLTQKQINKAKRTLEKIETKFSRPGFKIYFEKGRIDTYDRPNTDFEKCWMQAFVWAIGADMKVYPCCIMKYIDGWAFGDLQKQTLKDMVTDYDSYRKRDGINVMDCHNCWLRPRNISINGAVSKPKHENFI